MTEQPGLAVLLTRLLHRRNVAVNDVAALLDVPESELRAAMTEIVQNQLLLRGIAPILGLHRADLFVIAGLPVPDDLAPLDTSAGPIVGQLAGDASRLPVSAVRELRLFVESLPQVSRSQPTRASPAHEQYPAGCGAWLVRMLRNRNLGWLDAARVLYHVGGVGPLAASTVGAIGHGRKVLTPDLLAAFAIVLAIPLDDLACLTGIQLHGPIPETNATAAEVGELIWNVRRLSKDQIQQACDHARRLRQ